MVKNMHRRAAGTLFAVGLLVVTLGGCGNSAVSGPATPGATTKEQPVGAGDPKDDVKIVACETTQYSLKATIEVTNKLGRPWEYYGQIYFLDASGKRIVEGEFNTGTVEAGKTKTNVVPGQNLPSVAKATCELGWVKLDEPTPGK